MMHDMVNHPPHYETNGIECIDAMRASQGDEAVKDFCVCNAFKYIWRSTHKGSEIQDLEKAVWYLNKAIEIGKQTPDTNAEPDFAWRCKHCGCTFGASFHPSELIRHLTDEDHIRIPDGIHSLKGIIEEHFEKENL